MGTSLVRASIGNVQEWMTDGKAKDKMVSSSQGSLNCLGSWQQYKMRNFGGTKSKINLLSRITRR